MNYRVILFLSLFTQISLYTADINIRSFDLGGSGMKTARFVFYQDTQQLHLQDVTIIQFAKCPDDQEVADWIRLQLDSRGIDLDQEISQGYRFGFSLASLGPKLRNEPVATKNVAELFRLPPDKVFALHDGEAHALASHAFAVHRFSGEVWNIALGRGIGIGVMNNEHNVLFKHCVSVQSVVASLMAQLELAERCTPSRSGELSDSFIEDWVMFLKHLMQSKTPSGIIFTGGFMDHNGQEFLAQLKKLFDGVTLMQGPRNAGLYGAALCTVIWNISLAVRWQRDEQHVYNRSHLETAIDDEA